MSSLVLTDLLHHTRYHVLGPVHVQTLGSFCCTMTSGMLDGKNTYFTRVKNTGLAARMEIEAEKPPLSDDDDDELTHDYHGLS